MSIKVVDVIVFQAKYKGTWQELRIEQTEDQELRLEIGGDVLVVDAKELSETLIHFGFASPKQW